MARPTGKKPVSVSPPLEATRGEHDSLLLVMSDLPAQPVSGRLLRGLSPYLDEQGAAHVVLLASRRHREPWGAAAAVVKYQELVHWARGPRGGVFRGAVWMGHPLTPDEVLKGFRIDPLGVVDWAARRMSAAVVSSAEPLRLAPCAVPKPWGRELWYTGIEQRGRARIKSATGETELPYALGMFPVPIVGETERPPVLVKVLEPLPQPVLGDLYLEVHREKWEVYVALDVDPAAWPDGQGGLRAGLAPALLERYRAAHGPAWEPALTRDLGAAIGAYEPVRRRMDALLDEALLRRGADPAAGVPAALHDELAGGLPPELRAEEARLRQQVEAFLGQASLAVGDVAAIRPGVLHSLQHGVTVVEFQTPTYERLIAMFAQKVLTQEHWDTAAALERMEKAVYVPPAPEPLGSTAFCRWERIVEFPEFQVLRLRLEAGARHPSATAGGGSYQIVIGIAGRGDLALPSGAALPLEKAVAYLLPAALGTFSYRAHGDGPLTVLVTTPAGTDADGGIGRPAAPPARDAPPEPGP
jgi:hypothetical protein